MSVMSGSDLGDFLTAQSQLKMQGALTALSLKSETESGEEAEDTADQTVSAQRDELIVTMSSLAGIDVSSIFSSTSNTDSTLAGILGYDSTSSVSGSNLASYLSDSDYDSLISSLSSSTDLSSLLDSESVSLSDTLAAMLENPELAVLAQSNANALSVLSLFS